MRTFLLKFNKVFIALLVVSMLSSCLTTKTNVGKYTEAKGTEYTYSKAKQMWLFWGLIPIGRTHTETPADGNCQVVTKFNLVDWGISIITGGILISETVKVNAKK